MVRPDPSPKFRQRHLHLTCFLSQHALVGDDTFGKMLKARILEVGIADSVQVLPDVQTGVCIVLSSVEDRGFVTHRGATGMLGEMHLEALTHSVMSLEEGLPR